MMLFYYLFLMMVMIITGAVALTPGHGQAVDQVEQHTGSIVYCSLQGDARKWPPRQWRDVCVEDDMNGCVFGVARDGTCRWAPVPEAFGHNASDADAWVKGQQTGEIK